MKVSRWGNSLAIRLPAEVVARLNLKEGDDIDIDMQRETAQHFFKRRTHEEAIAHIRTMQRPFPEGWKFDRDEANER